MLTVALENRARDELFEDERRRPSEENPTNVSRRKKGEQHERPSGDRAEDERPPRTRAGRFAHP